MENRRTNGRTEKKNPTIVITFGLKNAINKQKIIEGGISLNLRQSFGQELDKLLRGGIVKILPEVTVVAALVLIGVQHGALILIEVWKELKWCPWAKARIVLPRRCSLFLL